MRILWITNIVLPEAQQLLTGTGALKESGGWMIGAANALSKQENLELTIATVSPQVKQLTCLKGDKIEYYLLPYGKGNDKYNPEYEPLWLSVKKEVKPDVVHIHGSEFTHGLAYLRACGSDGVVVSIQGLVSVYERYYYSGLSVVDILKNFTVRSLLGRSTFYGRRSFRKRGKLEKELFQSVNHIIGRTSWDRAHSWAINPKAKYHNVGEILRPEFYTDQWEYSKCVRHSIFLSQANYSVKGLHMVLKAMPLVLRYYPDTILRVAGIDITRHDTIKGWISYTDYGRIIKNMIKEYHLNNRLSFTGSLDGVGMKREYLNSNVFVCPSTIENSPNSLGEAQILGVPIVASYVGGVADMMRGDEDHLYRFEEIEMLAEKICGIFSAGSDQPQVSIMREKAQKRHDPQNTIRDLMNVYSVMVQRL